MADKSSGSGSHEEEEEEVKPISYKRKSRAMSDQEEVVDRMISESDDDVSMDVIAKVDDDDDDSIADQILEGETMASLTLSGEEDETKDGLEECLTNAPRRKRSHKKMMKLSNVYARTSPVNTVQGVLKISEEDEEEGEEVISPEKQGSRTQSQNSEDENESSLPASSPEAEKTPGSPRRLFSKQLTADDTNGRLHFSRGQMDCFPFSLDLTAEIFEAGRRVALQVVDEHDNKWKMMLTSCLEVDKTRGYCIDYGWKEFVDAHNLEIRDEIIFYQSPTSKDDKELIIEFIKAQIL